MTCIITGCDLIDIPGGRWVHGDLFRIDGSYVFNAVLHREDYLAEEVRAGEAAWVYGIAPAGTKALVIRDSRSDGFFERRGVIVVSAMRAHLNLLAEAYVRGRPV